METMRLRAIQEPARAESLLEAFALRVGGVPDEARRIYDEGGLCSSLRQVSKRALAGDGVWRAWTDDRHTWFFTGEVSLELSRERGRPVLRVCRYDDEANLEGCDFWVLARNGAWERCGG